jgi:putative acetyltransferase
LGSRERRDLTLEQELGLFASGRKRALARAQNLEIRESVPIDLDAIESLYPETFPDENLLPLVRDLLADAAVTTSLVGTIDSRIVGHAIFTKCRVSGSNVNAALLGPLAVAPAWQRRGFGSAIVRTGLRRLEEMEVSLVYVLGDPAYYERLGFRPESLVEPPFRLPPEWDGAWQSQNVGDVAALFPGKLIVPRQWLQPALWAP